MALPDSVIASGEGDLLHSLCHKVPSKIQTSVSLVMLTLYGRIIIRNGSKRACDTGRMKTEFWAGKINRWPPPTQPPPFKIRAHGTGDRCKGEKPAL